MASFESSDAYQASLQEVEGEDIFSHSHSRASPPTSLKAPISPAPSTRSVKRRKLQKDEPPSPPNLAAIEAGDARIEDHLAVFSEQHSQHIRPCAAGQGSLLNIDDFRDLYIRNQHRHGRHFVVHQHDHPVAGMLHQSTLSFCSSKLLAQFIFLQKRCLKGGHSGFKSAACDLKEGGRTRMQWTVTDES